MVTLRDVLSDPQKSPHVISACCELVESEVRRKQGLSGMAIKSGYAVARKLKPTLIRDVMEKLLPSFARALEPMYERVASASEPGVAFRTELERHPNEAAEALLGVTDKQAEQASPVLREAYMKLRKGASVHVSEAMPRLGRCVEPYL